LLNYIKRMYSLDKDRRHNYQNILLIIKSSGPCLAI
jgi:hypothetical protein